MIKYTDVYVSTFARGLCEPNEQFVAASAGAYQSFWTFRIPFFKHSYLLIATSERLIVVDHRKGLIFDRVDRVDSYRWSDIGTLKIGGMLSKSLTLKDASNRTVLKMKVPGFMATPIRNNLHALRTVVQTWEQRRALGASSIPPYNQLPQGQLGYGAPPPPPAPRAYS